MIAELRQAAETNAGRLVSDGRLMTERELMEVFGASRRTVRTVLAGLEDEGLLYRQQGQGTFLRPTSPNTHRVGSIAKSTSPTEIMEVRQEIEPALARLAAFRATPNDIDTMRRLVERAAASKTSNEYERWDAAFHHKLAESARNGLFISILNMIRAVRIEQNWTVLRAQVFNQEARDQLINDHRIILAAIEKREAAGAEAAMKQHLDRVSEILKTTMNPPGMTAGRLGSRPINLA